MDVQDFIRKVKGELCCMVQNIGAVPVVGLQSEFAKACQQKWDHQNRMPKRLSDFCFEGRKSAAGTETFPSFTIKRQFFRHSTVALPLQKQGLFELSFRKAAFFRMSLDRVNKNFKHCLADLGGRRTEGRIFLVCFVLAKSEKCS